MEDSSSDEDCSSSAHGFSSPSKFQTGADVMKMVVQNPEQMRMDQPKPLFPTDKGVVEYPKLVHIFKDVIKDSVENDSVVNDSVENDSDSFKFGFANADTEKIYVRNSVAFFEFLKKNNQSLDGMKQFSDADLMKTVVSFFCWLPDSNEMHVNNAWAYHAVLQKIFSISFGKSLNDLPNYKNLVQKIKALQKTSGETESEVAEVLQPDAIRAVMESYALDGDKRKIQKKAYFVLVVYNGNRTGDVVNLKTDAFRIDELKGEIVYYLGHTKTVATTKTIVRDAQHPKLCPFGAFLQYYNLVNRPKKFKCKRLFLQCSKAKNSVEFKNQPYGKGSLRKWMREILMDEAVFRFLPEWVQHEELSGVKDINHQHGTRIGVDRFTGHTGRRSGATILAENGASAAEIQEFGNWKSQSTSQGYVAKEIRKESQKRIMKVVNESSSSNIDRESDDEKQSDEDLEENEKNPKKKKRTGSVFENCTFQVENFEVGK